MFRSMARWLAVGGAVVAAGSWLSRYLRPLQSTLTLNEAVVIITGASAGIGRAYAEAFAKRGARVVLAARRADLLEDLRLHIETYASDVLAIPTDVNSEDDLRRLVDQTMQHYGRIDILVNNAGADAGGQLYSISLDEIRTLVRTNLEAPMSLTHLVLPTMLAQRSGKIVNIASIAGRIAQAASTVYSSSKIGLMGFSDALRRELVGTGIDVITVLPTWTRTAMVTPEINKQVNFVDDPTAVAERTIEGMLMGESEIVFGGNIMKFGLFVERHFPALMDLYWRSELTPQYIEAMRSNSQIGRN
ncbi:MAG: SDR family NAD(P)-dependent oxidoreductase [Anaerolineae bacterium]|nr:SDR family NAD(P)-dependent oxidoreductase [Anaerolineae bacterium]